MKKITFLLALLVVGLSGCAAPKISQDNFTSYRYGNPFIFVEGGVEFAVYPDGQFDFFYNRRGTGYSLNVVAPNINISFNSGYNYNPFVQYDDFGAVIQIESVPIYYDYYGRIIQAGNVFITYNHFGRVARIGGMHLHYNPYRQFTHFTGFINDRNPYYIERPWHRYYIRPHAHLAVVYHQPYRAYYFPSRMEYPYYRRYYKKHYDNDFRRSYYRPGEKVVAYHRGRRTGQVRDLERHNVEYVSRSERNRNTVDSERSRNSFISRSNRNGTSSDRTSTRSIRRARISSENNPATNNRATVRSRREATPERNESRTIRSHSPIQTDRGQVQREVRRPVQHSTRRATTIERERTPRARTSTRTSSPQKARVRSSRSSRGR